MKRHELDRELRRFESLTSHQVPLGELMVARLDGRGFTRLTKESLDFDKPFDSRFHDAMVEATKHVMDCGFRVLYAYTQSDEISLFFHPEETTFDRQVGKYNSVLAGEASACFSLALGRIAVFDCRISQLPSKERFVDYFRWRQEDARRNALNAYCYWSLRKEGLSARRADRELSARATKSKLELLADRGVIFDDQPGWQLAGVGLYWESYTKEGQDPRTGESILAERRRIRVEKQLPRGQEYAAWVERWLESS